MADFADDDVNGDFVAEAVEFHADLNGETTGFLGAAAAGFAEAIGLRAAALDLRAGFAFLAGFVAFTSLGIAGFFAVAGFAFLATFGLRAGFAFLAGFAAFGAAGFAAGLADAGVAGFAGAIAAGLGAGAGAMGRTAATPAGLAGFTADTAIVAGLFCSMVFFSCYLVRGHNMIHNTLYTSISPDKNYCGATV